MRLAREAGSPVLALTNIMGSQATRDADAVLFTRAGLEIGVAATKTHVAQVAALLLLALDLARARGTCGEDELARLGHEPCATCPTWSRTAARWTNASRRGVARRYHDERFFLYLGRGMGYGVCLEGALKLKEISYIPTEAYAAGEMKHGPIALLDNGSPVVVVADDCAVFPKLVSQHRGGARPRRRRDRRRHRRQRRRSTSCRADVLWVPSMRPVAGAHAGDGAAAAARLPHRRHQAA